VRYNLLKFYFIFIRRYFNSIEEIRLTIDFPPKNAFYSQLKQEAVNDEEYESAKQFYNYRRQLRYKLFIIIILSLP